MNFQGLFDVVAGLAGALGTWILKMTWDEIKDVRAENTNVRKDLKDFSERMPETYARRDDVKQAMEEIKALYLRIDDKLDRIGKQS